MLKNKNGFSDVIVTTIIGGLLGSLFITGVFVWKEIEIFNTTNNTKRIVNQIIEIKQEEKNDAIVIDKNETSNSDYKLMNGKCYKENCLFINNYTKDYVRTVGIATIEGYYTKYLDKAFGEEKYCDSITITGGNEKIIENIIGLVDYGNGLYDKNELNQPIANLYISQLSQSDKDLLLNSSKSNPIKMNIIKTHNDLGGGIPICYSNFQILGIENL